MYESKTSEDDGNKQLLPIFSKKTVTTFGNFQYAQTLAVMSKTYKQPG